MYEQHEGMIIYNVEPLEEAFPPTRLWHRDGQRDEIAFYLKPALKKKRIRNLYLHGPPGTGKTVLIKWILENHFQEISAYVNCFRFRTTKEIVKEILFKFGYVAKETEEISSLFKELEKIANRQRIIICLDEVDQIKLGDKDEILYNLTTVNCGLILISNRLPTQFYNLDQRVRDRLNLHDIEFPEYKVNELFDICKDRREFAFVPSTLPDEMMQLAAENSHGDARLLLLITKNAGRIAEERGAKKIEEKDIMKGVLEAKRLRKSKLLEKLNEHQKILYNILEQKKRMPAGQLYKQYCKSAKEPAGPRAFRYYMAHMCTLGLTKSIGAKKWRVYELVI
jgi:Cdc6-like AAA superfamily ATPase